MMPQNSLRVQIKSWLFFFLVQTDAVRVVVMTKNDALTKFFEKKRQSCTCCDEEIMFRSMGLS